MSAIVFRSDFFATDAALVRLKHAIDLRKLAARASKTFAPLLRQSMRTEAREAVVEARKYRRARQ